MANESNIRSREYRKAAAKRIVEKLGDLPRVGNIDEQGRLIVPRDLYEKD